MARHSSMVHVRMDSEVKQRASRALASMGLSASDAVRLLFHRIAVDQAFPLELKVPNAETQAAMDEADTLLKQETPSFATPDEAFAEPDKATR
ncbi:MAG: type II toxin-antitoxin system RelB/DinJ family antitoxin [Rhodospirillales bacterium]|nr:type II toxin-antitoxin system RelB/DinJ family antitoxin [Rhodospirillales bacterium]